MEGDVMKLYDSQDVVGLCCLGAVVGIPALVCLWLIFVCVVRLLNETVLDPDWRAARQAERRRILAWQQWEEDMLLQSKFNDATNCRSRSPNSAAAKGWQKGKADSPPADRHGIMA
jgi:hypothetical protein